MSRYLLLAYDRSDAPAISPDEMQAVIDRYMAWTGEIARRGQLVSAEKLEDRWTRVVRPAEAAVAAGGGSPLDRVRVSDGPFAEAQEVVGGFWVLECASDDEALAIAADCPHAETATLVLRRIEALG